MSKIHHVKWTRYGRWSEDGLSLLNNYGQIIYKLSRDKQHDSDDRERRSRDSSEGDSPSYLHGQTYQRFVRGNRG